MDGGTQTNYEMCTHTDGGPNPWWRVDLGRVEDVAEVHILNRGSYEDRLNGAEIRVGQYNTTFLLVIISNTNNNKYAFGIELGVTNYVCTNVVIFYI